MRHGARLSEPLPPFDHGSVWLVGAGPGDPGLMTRLGAHALQNADFVLHDSLVSEDVLGLVREGARFEFAGKRGGMPSTPQDAINRRMIRAARFGLRVVRLKGGDPFVFGRGAEEAEALADAGVPFRVVPGVTAGIGGLASAMIPTTSRRINHAVTLMTGRLEDGETLDWRPWVATGAPLVLYMALKTIEGIAVDLVDAGMRPETPVAVISNASTRAQSVIETRLGEVAAAVTEANIQGPAIIAIGEIVGQRARLLRR